MVKAFFGLTINEKKLLVTEVFESLGYKLLDQKSHTKNLPSLENYLNSLYVKSDTCEETAVFDYYAFNKGEIVIGLRVTNLDKSNYLLELQTSGVASREDQISAIYDIEHKGFLKKYPQVMRSIVVKDRHPTLKLKGDWYNPNY